MFRGSTVFWVVAVQAYPCYCKLISARAAPRPGSIGVTLEQMAEMCTVRREIPRMVDGGTRLGAGGRKPSTSTSFPMDKTNFGEAGGGWCQCRLPRRNNRAYTMDHVDPTGGETRGVSVFLEPSEQTFCFHNSDSRFS